MQTNPNSLANLAKGTELSRQEAKLNKEAFLTAYRLQWPNIGEAAKQAGIDRRQVLKWRETDKAFTDEMEAIKALKLDELESRIVEASKDRGYVHLALPVLKALRPDVWGDRSKVQHEGSLAWEIVSAVPRPMGEEAEQPGETIQ